MVLQRPFRSFARLLLVVVLAFGVAGCGGEGDGSAGAGDTGGQERGAATADTSSSSSTTGTSAASGSEEEDDDRRPPPASEETRSGEQRLRELAASLPLTEQAGQLVMTKLSAPTLTEEERDALRRGRIGGVIVFDFGYENPEQLLALAGEVQEVGTAASSARIGLFVAADQEGGPVRTFDDLPPESSAPTLGAEGSVQNVEEESRGAGELLSRHGVNMVLAPVADLALPPRRIMAGRSFGEDAATVGPLVAAWVRGMQDGGVSAAVKHFPGFGAASENSDLGVARVERTRDEVLEQDMAAFEPSLEVTDAVMVSHGIYEGLDAELPASLAPEVVEPLLRERLGYEGVVITDSLNARGLREAWGRSVPQACAQTIKVGADIALVTGTMETALLCRRQIVRGVRDGSIPRERLREALLRVLALKAKRGLLSAAG